MTPLVLLRHGPTLWTREHRLQGRVDLSLDAGGRAEVRRWRLPPGIAAFHWLASPLVRCTETAALLGLTPEIDPRLIEMDWGRWEGSRVAELQAENGTEVAALEARGLDLEPPGGESPRRVQARIAPLLAEIGARGNPTGLLTHKGVIRAILALATGWDMMGKPPDKLAWDALHLFRLDAAGAPSVMRLNWRLAPSAAATETSP
jgi:broad specificity phosphatase PhoE